MDASDLQKFSKDKQPSEKSFGITIAVALIIYSLLIRKQINILLFTISVLLVFSSFVIPKILYWPNKVWMKFGEILGKIVTPVVMAVIFYLFITPFGLLLRALNKLQFQYRFDQKANSFWIERSDSEFTPDKFKRQF